MEKSQQIRSFLFSQYLADGIKVTLGIIIPTLVFAYWGNIEMGMMLSLGALCVSISDGPGPVEHKRNGMLYCNIFVFVMALVTGFLNDNVLLLGILILVSTFVFTMFAVYGNRAATIGTAALLIMILRMTVDVQVSEVLKESLLILAGGAWYMIFALIFYKLTPYRAAQRSLGDCIIETANYLFIKAELYNPSTNLSVEYNRLLDQQVIVNEKQNEVRELLFKNRSILKESTHQGRMLVLTFTDVVDIFEHIMATWYDYNVLREKYAPTGILEEVSEIIQNIAGEMKSIGDAVHDNDSYKKNFELIVALDNLKDKIDNLSDNGSTMMLKKILVNLRNLGVKVDEILKYFNQGLSGKSLRNDKDYSRFVTHQKINGAVFMNNLTLNSSAFLHALRMMITCGVGFIVSKMMPNGHHSYWVLMTIIIILKPGFSLTKKKNFDRLTGTIGGGLIGLLILAFIHDKNVLFALIVFFMIGTYTFVRINYIVMVIFLTPYVLILFNFLGLGVVDVAGERLADTAVASLLAFLASYFLFPHWESKNLRGFMASVLKSNIHYLQKLQKLFQGNDISTLEHKLVRKDLFVSTANLSAALHRMLSEPKSKQRFRKEIYEFVVLNHVLSSNIAGLTESIYNNRLAVAKETILRVKNGIQMLEESLVQLDASYTPDIISLQDSLLIENGQADAQLTEQLGFIYKIIEDINRLCLKFTS